LPNARSKTTTGGYYLFPCAGVDYTILFIYRLILLSEGARGFPVGRGANINRPEFLIYLLSRGFHCFLFFAEKEREGEAWYGCGSNVHKLSNIRRAG